jgi:hypothetical protein
MRFTIFFPTILLLYSSIFASDEWMKKQISEDLRPFQNSFCYNCITKHFELNKNNDQLCLFIIKNNSVQYKKADTIPDHHDRFSVIYSTLRTLAQGRRLPNVIFLVSLHDTLNSPSPCPIFVMSKKIGDQKILFPDFEALAGRYQVIEGVDLETVDFAIPWQERRDMLIWRGSGAQGDITSENMHTKSRVKLCQLSMEYPSMIDAGFTFCIPFCIEQYRKEYLPFETIFSYKYQIWPDGNAASYSKSGWRFYSGSTVIKPDSNNIQWYYSDLKPWIHYVPVKENLEDLIDTLCLLKENESLAQQIAINGQQFAREHITQELNLKYLLYLLWSYSSCPIKRHVCP